MHSGSGLKTSGGGLTTSGGAFHQHGGSYQTGYGTTLGTKIKNLSKATTKTSPKGALGLALLHSLGHLIHQKKMLKYTKASDLLNKAYHGHLENYLKKHLKKGKGSMIGGKRMSVIDFIKKHENTPIHARDLWGSAHLLKGAKMLELLSGQRGGSFWGKLTGVAKKAGHKIGQFFKGKTKYKPSNLVSDLGKVGNVLGDLLSAVPDPRAQAAAKALKIGSKIAKPASAMLKKSGRGMTGSGKLPKWAENWCKNNPDDAKAVIDNILSEKNLAMSSPPYSKAQVKLWKLLILRRDLIDQCQEIIQTGGALYTAGIHKPKRKAIKCGKGSDLSCRMVGTKAQVFHGKADMTSTGITKDKLIKNKNGRIVQKSRSESGKRAWAKRSDKSKAIAALKSGKKKSKRRLKSKKTALIE
jgi:hypothetical protein